MSIVEEEKFSIPSPDYDYQSQYKQQLIRVLGKRFDAGDCKLYRNIEKSDFPIVFVKIISWNAELRVDRMEVSIDDGISIFLNNSECYQLDQMKFQLQSLGMIDPAYRVILCGDDGYSSFLIVID